MQTILKQQEAKNEKKFDFEDRCLSFALLCRTFVKSLKDPQDKNVYGTQLLRSSGSIGANYIEANDSLGEKDFLLRLKIARKEAKETLYWLRMTEAPKSLIQEGIELKLILSAMIQKMNLKK